jgi:branched-chain amino acid transport system substrate-binding protein
MKRSWFRWLCVAVVAALATALAGTTAVAQSSGGSTNGNAAAAKAVKKNPLTGPAGSGLTRGVSSDSVKVGCYLQAQNFAGAEDGYKARFERANNDKELPGGRKIDFTGCEDDGGNAQTNLTIVQRLVQQDQVFAVVGISADVATGSTNFMNTNQVPYYGWGFLPGFCAQRWGFGFNGCLVTNYPGAKQKVYQANLAQGPMQAAGLTAKQTKVALQTDDNEAGHNGNKTISELFTGLGAKVVYNEANMPLPGPPASYTPYTQAVTATNPNLVLNLLNFNSAPGFNAALAGAGYKGVDVNFVAYVPGLLSLSAQLAQALDGAYVSSQIVPQEQNTAYIKQILKDQAASGAKKPDFISFGAAIAYAQADLLVSQLKAAGKTLNTKTFDQKINGGSYTYKSSAAGGPGQMEFPSMHFAPADCAAILLISGTTYQVKVPFTCYPSVVKK